MLGKRHSFGLILVMASAATGAVAQQYSIADLGTLGGTNPPRLPFSSGTSINASGQVTGYSIGLTPPDQQIHAFISNASTNALTDLGELAVFGGVSQGYGVNASGQVTGNAVSADFDGPIHAFVTDASTHALLDLGTLDCGTQNYCNGSSYGTAINDKGQVTGYSTAVGAGVYSSEAFITDPVTHGMQPLLLTCDCSSAGYGINAGGQVTGWTSGGLSPSAYKQAFILDTNTSVVTWLGTLGGTASVGYGINIAGQVTGAASTASGATHAFLYTAGSMSDLGTLGGTTSQGNAVNAGGVVTGTSAIGSGDSHAFVYANGVMTDLNDMIGSAAGLYTLSAGQGINDSGQIVVNGVEVASGRAVAFVLTPALSAPRPTASITVSPVTVYEGQTVNVGWSSTSAASCTPAGAWAGTSIGVNGSTQLTFPREGTYSFILTCTGAGGTASASAALSVISGITLQLGANDIPLGGATRITWTAFAKATSCQASGAWTGSLPVNGSQAIGPLPAGSYSFQLTCSGSGLTTTALRSLSVFTPEQFSYASLTLPDNIYALTAPGAPVAAGGLDYHGYAYSSQALPYPLTALGQTFEMGAASQPSGISNKTITLSGNPLQGLAILATAVNGNQRNQSFLVTYSDGSTTNYVQSVSDWGSPQGYPGETVAATMDYRITPTGAEQNATFDLYAYRIPVDSSKSAVSLKLPANRDVIVLAVNQIQPIQARADTIDAPYNVYGIASAGHPPANGGLDGHGYAYEADLVSPLTWSGLAFSTGPANQPSALAKAVITLPSMPTLGLSVIAAAVNGNQPNQVFVVTYADGSTTAFTQSMSDWGSPQNYPGESIALTTSDRITPSGDRQAGAWHMYGYQLQTDPTKVISGLTIPKNRDVVVLSVDSQTAEAY